MQPTQSSKATTILVACASINLAIGILYAWAVFKQAFVAEWGWSNSDASLPYTVSIAVFALSLLLAGILQDRMGPRLVVMVGGILTGSGLILSSFASSAITLVMTFGIVTGMGIGFAYACVTPAAMKWYHPSRKGMVSGIVAGGFGLGAVFLAPLASWLIGAFGIATSFLILGTGVLAATIPLSLMINNPPEGYKPAEPAGIKSAANNVVANNLTASEMMKTPQFYTLWIMFVLSSSAGLMIIGNIASIATLQANIPQAAFLVSLLAIFNCAGRVVAGMMSDRIGRINTLLIVFVAQALNMLAFKYYDSTVMMVIGAAVAGSCYGALLSVFPSTTADYYGLKNYGTNYGIVYTAWGFSGLVGPIIAAWVMDMHGNFEMAYTISAGLLGLAFILALMTKPVSVEQKGTVADNAADMVSG